MRKRPRHEEAVASSKKAREGRGAATTGPSGKGSGEDGGEKQLVKTGFFSGEAFTDLPLSMGMLDALASLKFTTTTKIQASATLLFYVKLTPLMCAVCVRL